MAGPRCPSRIAILVIAAAAILAAVLAAAQDADERLVSVNGRRVRVKTAGLQPARSGVPAVVFETGLQSPLEAWLTVPGDTAEFAAVVTYDRAGLGQSESAGQIQTPSLAARHLHALLAQIAIKPPYILVGHSYGGLLIGAFAALYPGEVAGLVYVDPTDARSEAQSMEYYKARGYKEEDVPKLRAQLAQRCQAPPGTEMAVAMELERTQFAEIRALPPAPGQNRSAGRPCVHLLHRSSGSVSRRPSTRSRLADRTLREGRQSRRQRYVCWTRCRHGSNRWHVDQSVRNGPHGLPAQ